MSKYSVISKQADFTDDILIQKVVYYISLFKDEVKSYLDNLKEQDPFNQAINDDDDDNEMDFMFIDLESLQDSVLDLIL